MARMGNYNLQLQEIAEELGFSTTQEALDNGYHVVEDLVAGTATLKKLDEQEQAYEAWLKEKRKALLGLASAKTFIESLRENCGLSPAWCNDYRNQEDYIEFAIKFIEGVSHE